MVAATRTAGGTVVPDIPSIRRRDGEQRATFFELFFDLVYVFAVTQLSHHLLEHLTWEGAAQTAFMLVAVYWAWNYTTWMANWFDPDAAPVRLVLIYVMLASLLMAVAVPSGFGDLALLFAGSYAALQIGRNAFVVAVTPAGAFNSNFRLILAWSVLSAPLWIAGGLIDDLRWPLWGGALALDLAAPLVRYWLPKAGATPMSQWEIDGNHFGERFQLFVIIALGESIVLAGVTTSQEELTGAVAVALGFAFLSSTALWWLYFDGVARAVLQRIRDAGADVGAVGRDVYTYLHLPIIAGIVLTAVGDELVIAHPMGELHVAGALVTLGAAALFLVGLMACAARIGAPIGWARLGAVVVLLGGIPIGSAVSGLLVAGFVVAVLAALIVADVAARRRSRADVNG